MNNSYLVYILLPIALFFIIQFVIRKVKKGKRKKIYQSRFSQQWIEILENNFPLYKKFPKELKTQLHGLIHIFLAEKNFVGYEGIEIDDEIRVLIAANACVLLLNRKTNYYPFLHNILVYPSHFRHHAEDNGQFSRSGESWLRGPLVLSWSHSKSGSQNSKDGSNVIMHEFAHQLDQENGVADGLPILRHNKLVNWSRVFNKEYNKVVQIYERGKKAFIDEYGTTNPAEFFSVVTEQFFEQAKIMKRKHPDLYQELSTYYQLDPLDWNESHES